MHRKQFILPLKKDTSLSKSFLLAPFYLEDLYYVSFQHERFFLLKKNHTFFTIPFFLKIKKDKDLFILESIENSVTFSADLYFGSFTYWLKSYNKKIKQKLILKGLGFRSYLSVDKTEIFFKIGFSHIISLKVPTKIFSVTIEKNFLIFEAYDNVVLGNFCKRVKKLRKLDVYKNKGFSSKNEIIHLKSIKKT